MILRQSSIKSFLYCPAQYRAQYILGLNLGTFDPNMMFGTDQHKEVEKYHAGKPHKADKRYTDVYAPEDASYIEHFFSWDMPLAGHTLEGTIDRIDAKGHLHDLKTSRVSYSQRKVDEDIQATAYLAYNYYATGELTPFTFDVLRKDLRANGQQFPLQVISTTRTKNQLIDFQYFCARVASDMESEQEFRCLCRDQAHAVFSKQDLYI